jgi:hypothetical protein
MKRCLVILCICAGCTDVKSSAITTEGMNAQFTATAGESTTTVAATLRVGGELSNTYVDLEEGDSLEATDGDETQTLAHQSLGAFHEYNASFQSTEAETMFTFSLNRSSGDNAPASTATLPEPFSITAPATGENLSRGNDVLVEWESAGTSDKMQIQISGDCIGSYVETIDDDGSHTVSAGSLGAFEESERCQATITVERQRVGQLDPAFGAGSSYGVQNRTLDFRTDP